jgi:hypothetical protein
MISLINLGFINYGFFWTQQNWKKKRMAEVDVQ